MRMVRSKVYMAPTGKGRPRPVVVEAEYFKVENGTLIFRIAVPGGYPRTVHMFAPGTWLHVEVGYDGR